MKNTKMHLNSKTLRLKKNARIRLPIHQIFELLSSISGEEVLFDYLENKRYFIPNINAYDKLDRSILYVALFKEKYDFAKLLLENGADPNQLCLHNGPYEIKNKWDGR